MSSRQKPTSKPAPSVAAAAAAAVSLTEAEKIQELKSFQKPQGLSTDLQTFSKLQQTALKMLHRSLEENKLYTSENINKKRSKFNNVAWVALSANVPTGFMDPVKWKKELEGRLEKLEKSAADAATKDNKSNSAASPTAAAATAAATVKTTATGTIDAAAPAPASVSTTTPPTAPTAAKDSAAGAAAVGTGATAASVASVTTTKADTKAILAASNGTTAQKNDDAKNSKQNTLGPADRFLHPCYDMEDRNAWCDAQTQELHSFPIEWLMGISSWVTKFSQRRMSMFTLLNRVTFVMQIGLEWLTSGKTKLKSVDLAKKQGKFGVARMSTTEATGAAPGAAKAAAKAAAEEVDEVEKVAAPAPSFAEAIKLFYTTLERSSETNYKKMPADRLQSLSLGIAIQRLRDEFGFPLPKRDEELIFEVSRINDGVATVPQVVSVYCELFERRLIAKNSTGNKRMACAGLLTLVWRSEIFNWSNSNECSLADLSLYLADPEESEEAVLTHKQKRQEKQANNKLKAEFDSAINAMIARAKALDLRALDDDE